MTTEDKLIKMFHAVNPDLNDSKSCSVEVVEYNEWDAEPTGYYVQVVKGGHVVLGYTPEQLLFEYVTLDWE